MSYNTKNYTEQGGDKTVIGGEILIKAGAKIKAEEGADVEGFGSSGYVLPAATAAALGGVKVGTTLNIATDGTLNIEGASCIADSVATDVNGLKTDINSLIAALKAAGLMKSE